MTVLLGVDGKCEELLSTVRQLEQRWVRIGGSLADLRLEVLPRPMGRRINPEPKPANVSEDSGGVQVEASCV